MWPTAAAALTVWLPLTGIVASEKPAACCAVRRSFAPP